MSNTTPAVSVFNFNSNEVRTVSRDGAVWFVAVDVCNALGYSNTSKAIGDHLDADEKANESLGLAGSPVNIINESSLYALVLRSRKPEARKFAKWVTSEVLPAIRKTGSYSATPEAPSMKNRRWLISFDHLDRECVQEIEWNDCVLKYQDLPKLIRAQDNMINTELLTGIIHACTDRLESRINNQSRITTKPQFTAQGVLA